EKILEAIRQLLKGDIFLTEAVTMRILRQQMSGQNQHLMDPLARLSDREQEVFRLLGEWKTTREIASELGLSTKTVEYYRERLKVKLHLSNANELLQAATHWSQDPIAHHSARPEPQTIS